MGAINGTHLDEENSSQQVAMNLDASVNVFGQKEVGGGVDSDGQKPSKWVIQTKFETPMLNFNHLSASNSITLSNNGEHSVPRGMWHQYGRLEEDPSKGIFLQVTDVPEDWAINFLGITSVLTGSLVDVCGFSTDAVSLGQLAPKKFIS